MIQIVVVRMRSSPNGSKLTALGAGVPEEQNAVFELVPRRAYGATPHLHCWNDHRRCSPGRADGM